MKHIKQLDAIRAIAVILVLIWHGFPYDHIINRIPNGPIGVNVFFVLSGFLISRILMQDKVQAQQTGISRLRVFKNFFFRRALRIFPIYYLTIFVLWCVNGYADSNIESNMGYFLTYTSNFYFFKIQSWDGILSHTWSLAIEEQFYLVWPWIILYINRKYLLPVIALFITIGIVSQYATTTTFGEFLPHTCLDAFGIGAFLAWIMVFRPAALSRVYPVLLKLAIIAFLLLILETYMGYWKIVPLRTIVGVITAWLIAYVLYRRDHIYRPFTWVLNNRPLIFLGKISYGIYLYHPIIPRYTTGLLVRFNQYIPWLGNHLMFLEQSVLVILTAWISWRLVEQPILGLKKYFTIQHSKSSHTQTEAGTATTINALLVPERPADSHTKSRSSHTNS
jgi:peptidoglycan/LPS O-acetylase OafA/YrhL